MTKPAASIIKSEAGKQSHEGVVHDVHRVTLTGPSASRTPERSCLGGIERFDNRILACGSSWRVCRRPARHGRRQRHARASHATGNSERKGSHSSDEARRHAGQSEASLQGRGWRLSPPRRWPGHLRQRPGTFPRPGPRIPRGAPSLDARPRPHTRARLSNACRITRLLVRRPLSLLRLKPCRSLAGNRASGGKPECSRGNEARWGERAGHGPLPCWDGPYRYRSRDRHRRTRVAPIGGEHRIACGRSGDRRDYRGCVSKEKASLQFGRASPVAGMRISPFGTTDRETVGSVRSGGLGCGPNG